MPRSVPPVQGRTPSPAGPSPAPEPPPAGGLAGMLDYKRNQRVPHAAASFGLTMAEVEKYGPHNRLSQEGPVPGHLTSVFRTRNFDPRSLDNQVPAGADD